MHQYWTVLKQHRSWICPQATQHRIKPVNQLKYPINQYKYLTEPKTSFNQEWGLSCRLGWWSRASKHQGEHTRAKTNPHTHSFIHLDHFYSASSSPLLFRSTPDTARILCWSFTLKRHRQLWVKDLPKVPTWQLERELNPRPSGWKLLTQPMCHHVPHTFTY